MPFAFWAMLTGVLSICGIPGFSGFFSKDQVIYGALVHGHPWLYAAGVLTAGITAYYMFRLLFLAFLGEYRGTLDTGHLHLPSWVMNLPVGVLVVPTVAVGGALMFGGENSPWSHFFAPLFGSQTQAIASIPVPPISEGMTSALVFVLVILGFAIAWWRYASAGAQRDAVERLRVETGRMPAILANRFYVDEAIELLVVRPTQRLGLFFGRVLDPHVLDGAVRELVFWAGWLGAVVRSFQTGFVRAYALILVVGAACFIVYYAIAAAGAVH
jgi:NADH-quinone oxidoreductase subunit L